MKIKLIEFVLLLILSYDCLQNKLTSVVEGRKRVSQRKRKGHKSFFADGEQPHGNNHAEESQNRNSGWLEVQRKATKEWMESLHESDYDPTYWVEHFHQQPQNFFEHYIRQLSAIFAHNGAKVNFALVGACDGTNDRTISKMYLKEDHWRGVFVEPFEINFKDLNNFMEEHKVSSRTHLIHGAATNHCNSSTIKMKRPTYEEKAPDKPHWMRRQIGSVVPADKLDRPMTGGWKAEFVRCLTANDILRDWAASLNRVSGSKIKKMRVHVLKVDVEGHDYQVLSSFFDMDEDSQLPLLISFEAKSIGQYWDVLKEKMESLGYAVSHFANDGFALLKAEYIMKKKKVSD